MRAEAAAACCLTLASVLTVEAQSTSDARVQITAAYAASWLQLDGSTGLQGLFNGRIGFRVAPAIYVGVSAGSWTTAGSIGAPDPQYGQLLDGVASAVVASSYAQWYPLRCVRTFVRGGLGFAHATTYTPAQISEVPAPLTEEDHIRPSATSGMGIDLPLSHRLAMTLSLDYTRIFGNLPAAEVHSLVMAGFGLTLH